MPPLRVPVAARCAWVSWVELLALLGLRRAVQVAEDLPSHKKRCRDGFYSYWVVVEVVEIERR